MHPTCVYPKATRRAHNLLSTCTRRSSTEPTFPLGHILLLSRVSPARPFSPSVAPTSPHRAAPTLRSPCTHGPRRSRHPTAPLTQPPPRSLDSPCTGMRLDALFSSPLPMPIAHARALDAQPLPAPTPASSTPSLTARRVLFSPGTHPRCAISSRALLCNGEKGGGAHGHGTMNNTGVSIGHAP